MIGSAAGTAITEAAQLYRRYEGDIATGAGNHSLNLGVRISW